MQYNIYFRKDNWTKFEAEKEKSKLVNELLDKHYGQFPIEGNKYPKVQTKIEAPSKKELLSIPGIKRASEIPEVCTGHDHFRANCGRKGCKYA